MANDTIKEALRELNKIYLNENYIKEDIGDVLEDQKESYLITSNQGKNTLVASIKNNKLTPSWVTSQSITKYNQIRFLSADDAQKFNDKYNLNGNVEKAWGSYNLIEINLDPTIKTYINKAWASKISANTLKSVGLQDIKLYSEDTLNEIKEIFNIFDSKITKFDLVNIIIKASKYNPAGIWIKDIYELEQDKNKLIDVQEITLNLKRILNNIVLYSHIDIINKELNTIDDVSLSACPKYIRISGSKEEIKKETASIPNISVIIDAGDFLLNEIRKDVDYESHIQELKGLGVKSLKDISRYYDWRLFDFEDFYLQIDFGSNIWIVKSTVNSNYVLELRKTSPKEYSIDYSLGSKYDLYDNYGLSDKANKAEDELNKEIKNSNINLIELLNKISAYWEKEDNNIDRDTLYKGINKCVYDIGQNLLDLAEADLKLGE